MRFIDTNNKLLFDASGIFKVGEKVGFNFDNKPTYYAVFDILSIENNVAVINESKLIINNDTNKE